MSKQINLFESSETQDMLGFEKIFLNRGFRLIAGVDEAGRGPLAGPVVAAAVILKPGQNISDINDSKKLTEKTRERLYSNIIDLSLSTGVGIVDAETIDRINILQATRLAMLRAVEQLQLQPDLLLIDGITKIESPVQQQTIKQGDARSASIAAASILAKVTRDRLMREYDRIHPGYGFAGHKGYGCKAHMDAIATHGPSPIHRKSFSGVKEHS